MFLIQFQLDNLRRSVFSVFIQWNGSHGAVAVTICWPKSLFHFGFRCMIIFYFTWDGVFLAILPLCISSKGCIKELAAAAAAVPHKSFTKLYRQCVIENCFVYCHYNYTSIWRKNRSEKIKGWDCDMYHKITNISYNQKHSHRKVWVRSKWKREPSSSAFHVSLIIVEFPLEIKANDFGCCCCLRLLCGAPLIFVRTRYQLGYLYVFTAHTQKRLVIAARTWIATHFISSWDFLQANYNASSHDGVWWPPKQKWWGGQRCSRSESTNRNFERRNKITERSKRKSTHKHVRATTIGSIKWKVWVFCACVCVCVAAFR